MRVHAFPIVSCLLLWSTASLAATGVSEERLSLPRGPGSLEGIGENISLNLNMGAMTYHVPIEVPAGFPGATPQVSLDYSSANGTSLVGMGWSLALPSIERLTVRGLPRYTTDDEFSVDGGEELVHVAGPEPRTYRARFEKGFIRYTWHDAGAGAEGWWQAEHPDGRSSTYGADHDGTLVPAARVGSGRGIFRYHLVETVDRYGHAVRYTWKRFGEATLPERIGWVFTDGVNPEYEVAFAYEDRYDRISDGKAGFEELLDQRLARVDVLAHGQIIRSYALDYEDYATSGGFTRLTGVQLHGRDGGAYPVRQGFEYSRALGVDCRAGDPCEQPYVVSMGTLGLDIGQGKATLIDLDGDSLPDVVDATEEGKPHRVFLNVLGADGSHGFAAPFQSAVGSQSGHALGSSYAQVLDVNGDGFTDLVNTQTGDVLANRGTGDWSEVLSLGAGAGLPDLGAAGTLASVKFFDYNGDKRIDLMLSRFSGSANETLAWLNTPTGFVADPEAENVGEGFETAALELNDMNGDGLLDVVQVLKDALRYRLNLGWGHWSDWRLVTGFDFTDQEAVDAELEDLNGDGLADLVLVAGNELRYWVNRNGTVFDAERVLTGADVAGDLPEKKLGTTVLYADLNGNGSSDVVWVQGAESGSVTYLELFPARPNLITRITNALGRVTDVTYGSSVVQRARDAATSPWPHPLPSPMTVVTQTDEWDELTLVHTVTDYAYHDGYFDGVEKRFRGYASVEGALAGDDLQQPGTTYETYDVGVSDPYRAGLTLAEEQVSGGRSLQLKETTYADCSVAGVPDQGLLFPVRNLCAVREAIERREGAPEADWATVVTAWTHDGYGNTVLESKLGVTSVGAGACAPCEQQGYTGTPCGAQCLGDEAYTRTEYATPDANADRWIVDRPVRQLRYGVAAGEGEPATDVVAETRTYYDGPAFTGLPGGQVTHGTPTRVVETVDAAGATRDKTRSRLDAHGNVIESLDPLGQPEGSTHRRLYTLDADGLRVVRVDVLNEDGSGPYALRREVQYDPAWDKPIESTAWMLVEGGEAKDARNATYYTYDEFGRITATLQPGDDPATPSEAYAYELGNPASRVVVKRRSVAGGAFDLEEATCFDGRGREVQSRQRLGQGEWQVSGFAVRNLQGLVREVFDPYVSSGADCDLAPPAGTLSVRTAHDALGREAGVTWPAAGDDAPPTRRIEQRPLQLVTFDAEDDRAGGPHEGTPTVALRNGAGVTVAVHRWLQAGAEPLVHRFRYDELGHLAAVVDPSGAAYERTNDLLGQAVEVQDPDAGTTRFDYDAGGNLVRREDARGSVLRFEFDGLNRTTREWVDGDEPATLIERRYDRRGDCPADACTNVAGALAAVRYPLGADVGEDRLGYTVRGNLAYTSRTLHGHAYELQTLYDNADRVVGTISPTGRRLDVTLDGADRPVAISGVLDEVTFDERGLPASYLLANGVETTLVHDEGKRLAHLSAAGPDGAPLLDYAYQRDLLGHVLAIADGRATAGHASANATYAYDALYRLREAVLDGPNASLAETLTFDLDAADRIDALTSSRGAASPAHVGDYAYGQGAGPHAVTRAGQIAFGYDPAGHLTTRGDLQLTWDARGHLVSASRAGMAVEVVEPGPDRHRLVKRAGGHLDVTPADEFEVRDGVAVTYALLDDQRLARIEEPSFQATFLSDLAPATGDDQALEPDPDGQITAADAWLAAATGAGALTLAAPVPVDDAATLLHASARRVLFGLDERVIFLHSDHLKNVVAETDAAGAVVARRAFYPYGAERATEGAPDPHGFTGKERDPETGLVSVGARYLDPVTGRWTSPDPAFLLRSAANVEQLAESTTAYGFADDDPVNHRDPDGHAKTSVLTGFWGKFRMAWQLWKGQTRPNLEWSARFKQPLAGEVRWKTAWNMAKGAQEATGRSQGWSPFALKSDPVTLQEMKQSQKGILGSQGTYNAKSELLSGVRNEALRSRTLGAFEAIEQSMKAGAKLTQQYLSTTPTVQAPTLEQRMQNDPRMSVRDYMSNLAKIEKAKTQK